MAIVRHATIPFFCLALSACGLTGPAHEAPPPEAHVIEMTTLSQEFTPPQITIRQGDTVEWRNTSFIEHTVTADPSAAKNPANVILPSGAEPFDSGRIPPGEVYRRTFTTPGAYRYVCVPHEEEGMIGTVVVTPAS